MGPRSSSGNSTGQPFDDSGSERTSERQRISLRLHSKSGTTMVCWSSFHSLHKIYRIPSDDGARVRNVQVATSRREQVPVVDSSDTRSCIDR